MTFVELLIGQVKETFPGVFLWAIALFPFMVAEQLWPVGEAPRLRDYGLNLLISWSTVFLVLPIGLAAGLWSTQLGSHLPWKPASFNFDTVGQVPYIGPGLEILAMVFVPLFLHDLWFYWAHRIEHKVPLLWEFHKVHHSDECMNCSTFARDQFLQAGWVAFFPVFTLGLFVDLNLAQAGKAALYSNLFLMGLSMFYHSAIRIRVPGFNRILVTPQVHRIHHSLDPEHHNSNFADALPIFDILFGTYRPPAKDEFPVTGLADRAAPRSVFAAQFAPLRGVWTLLRPALGNQTRE